MTNRLWTASEDGYVKEWDLNAKPGAPCTRTFYGHREDVFKVIHCPTTNKLYTASYDKTAKEWDLNAKPSALSSN